MSERPEKLDRAGRSRLDEEKLTRPRRAGREGPREKALREARERAAREAKRRKR